MDVPDHQFETIRLMNQATLTTQLRSKSDTANVGTIDNPLPKEYFGSVVVEDEPEKRSRPTRAAHETEDGVKELKLPRSHFIMSRNTTELQDPSQWSQADVKEFLEYFVIKRILIDDEFILDPYADYGEEDEFIGPVDDPRQTVSTILRRGMSYTATRHLLGKWSSFLEYLEDIDIGQLYDDDYTLLSVVRNPYFQKQLHRTKQKLEICQEASGYDELALCFSRKFVYALGFLRSAGTFTNASDDDYKSVFYTFLDFICCQRPGFYAEMNSKTYQTRICKVSSPFERFTIRMVPDVIIVKGGKCDPNNILAIVEVKKDPSGSRFKKRKQSNEILTGQIAVRETDEPCGDQGDSHRSAEQGEPLTSLHTPAESGSGASHIMEGNAKKSKYMKVPKKRYHEEDGEKIAKYEVSKSDSDSDCENLRKMFKYVDLATCRHLTSTEKKFIESFLPQLLAEVFTVFDNYCENSFVSRADLQQHTRKMRYAIGVMGFKVIFVTVVIICQDRQEGDEVTLNPQGFPIAKFRGMNMHTDVFVTKQLDLLKKDDRKRIGEILSAILIDAK